MVKRDELGRFTKECVGKENIFYRKHHKEKTKIEHGEVIKQKWKNPEYRKNQIEKRKGQHSSPETEFKKGLIPWSKKGLKGIRVSPQSEFKKGHKPWNKNLTKEDPRIAKLGEKTSKTLLERGSLRGEKHPMYGKHHTEKAKNIIGLKGKKNWQNQEYKKMMIESHIRYFKEHPEEKERMRKQRAKLILPTKDTSIEVKIQNFLKTLGIEFFTHQKMNIKHAYRCDILIPAMNLVIECDGGFIHCNPSKYPPKFVRYPSAKKIITAQEIWDRDKIRTSELIEKGFKVLRLWEFEIRAMELNDFKENLVKFI